MALLEYFFSLRPGSAFSYYLPLLIIAGVLILGSIVLQVYIKKHKENRAIKKLFSGLPNKLKWISGLMLFLLASRYENIPYFSMRIWLYLDFIALIYVLGKNLYLLTKKYPAERAYFHRQQHIKGDQTEHKHYSTKKKKKK